MPPKKVKAEPTTAYCNNEDGDDDLGQYEPDANEDEDDGSDYGVEEEVVEEVVDEETGRIRQVRRKNGAGGGHFEMPEELPDIHYQRRTISDLMDMLDTPYVDLDPDYQRAFVWSTDRQISLVNSILSNFYVPPVIFNVTKREDENGTIYYHRTSVDGKQRLTSLKRFVQGEIPCTDENNKRWYYCNKDPQHKRPLLPQTVKDKFDQKFILCVECTGLARSQEEDLFSRVQLGMPLTPAEKLRASTSHWQEFAIHLETKYSDLLTLVDNGRGRGFQSVLQILRMITLSQDEIPSYSPGASTLKSFVKKPKTFLDSIRDEAESVFRRYDEVKREFPTVFENQNYKHSLKFSPVEFVGVSVLIHTYPDRNCRLLAGDIIALREYLRSERQDLRSNTRTWTTIKRFIDDLEKLRGAPSVPPRIAPSTKDIPIHMQGPTMAAPPRLKSVTPVRPSSSVSGRGSSAAPVRSSSYVPSPATNYTPVPPAPSRTAPPAPMAHGEPAPVADRLLFPTSGASTATKRAWGGSGVGQAKRGRR